MTEVLYLYFILIDSLVMQEKLKSLIEILLKILMFIEFLKKIFDLLFKKQDNFRFSQICNLFLHN